MQELKDEINKLSKEQIEKYKQLTKDKIISYRQFLKEIWENYIEEVKIAKKILEDSQQKYILMIESARKNHASMMNPKHNEVKKELLSIIEDIKQNYL